MLAEAQVGHHAVQFAQLIAYQPSAVPQRLAHVAYHAVAAIGAQRGPGFAVGDEDAQALAAGGIPEAEAAVFAGKDQQRRSTACRRNPISNSASKQDSFENDSSI